MTKYTKEQLEEIQQQLQKRKHLRYLRDLLKTTHMIYGGDRIAPVTLTIPKLMIVGDLERAKKDYESAIIYYAAASKQLQEHKKGVFVMGRDGWTLEQCQGMLVSRLERLLDQMQEATVEEKLTPQQSLERERSIGRTVKALMQYH